MKTLQLSFFGVWDIISLTLVFIFTAHLLEIGNSLPQWLIISVYTGLIGIWVIIAHTKNLYVILKEELHLKSRILKYLESYFILTGVLSIIFLFFSLPSEFKNLILFISLGFPLTALIVNSLVYRVSNNLVQIKLKNSKTLIAGHSKEAERIASMLRNSNTYKININGFVNCGIEMHQKSSGYVTDIEGLSDYINHHIINEIIVSLPLECKKEIQKIREICDYEGIRFKYAMNYEELFGEQCSSVQFGSFQLVNVRHIPLDNALHSIAKDIFDIIFSGLALFFLLPVMVIVGLLIKIESPGSVFYCPIRIGKNGQPFKLYKFRSMHENDPTNAGEKSTEKDDPRISRIGKFIRKYSIDEIPQFINVLKGEMSVVGPRPHRVYLNNKMRNQSKKYMIRHYYKPGITGWAQVNGWRGPLDTSEQIVQRTEHDLFYLKNWSIGLDIKIIWMTVFGKKTHKSAF